MVFCQFENLEIIISAGTSPTLWTRGLATLGLAGTRGPASPIEELVCQNRSSRTRDIVKNVTPTPIKSGR